MDKYFTVKIECACGQFDGAWDLGEKSIIIQTCECGQKIIVEVE